MINSVQVSLLVVVIGLSVNSGNAQSSYQVPLTEYGQPDLQGVWNFASNIPLERPEQFGNKEILTVAEVAQLREQREAQLAAAAAARNADESPQTVGGYNDFWFEVAGLQSDLRTSLIVYPANGRIPPVKEGIFVQKSDASGDTVIPGDRPVRYTVGGIGYDGPEDRGLSERCLVGFNSGPPFIPSLYNNNVQIFQSKHHAVILTEMIHDARIVSLEDRIPLDAGVRQWSGDSRGYFDGDVLVVETRNFNQLTGSFGNPSTAYGVSTHKVLTERFIRKDFDTMEYEFTIEDSENYIDKIVARIPMTKVAGQLYEYACHEGNYGLTNILRGARAQEMKEVSNN